MNAKHTRTNGIVALAAALLLTLMALATPAQTPSPAVEPSATLQVKGAVKQELHLTSADLKSMPRTKISAKGHEGATHEYEGVALPLLLAKAGVPQSADLRGKSMALCVIAEGTDGYRAAFSLAELTPTSPPNPSS